MATTMVVALTSGMLYQMNCYGIVSLSSLNRQDYLEVAQMYDKIIALSKELGIKKPRISVNFTENYVLGCGEAITAYQYEHAGELFRIRAKLGSDIGKEYKKDEAIQLIEQSDFMLLDTSPVPDEQNDSVRRELLSRNLAQYPFSQSMLALRPVIRKYVEDNFLLKGSFRIFQREIKLYVNKNVKLKPVAIRASSQLNDRHSADTILDESSRVWHSEGNPHYPQWVEFEYKDPVAINNISILCQIGAPQRAPSKFRFQGRDADGDWVDLLEVSDAGFKDGEEQKSWPVDNVHAFKYYRLYIEKNNGAPDLLTIQQISFRRADNKGV